MNELTEAQIYELLEKSHSDMKAGRMTHATKVFEELKEEFNL